jgi:hypothetical protein
MKIFKRIDILINKRLYEKIWELEEELDCKLITIECLKWQNDGLREELRNIKK